MEILKAEYKLLQMLVVAEIIRYGYTIITLWNY